MFVVRSEETGQRDGERERQRDDQRRAHVPEQAEEHEDDEHSAEQDGPAECSSSDRRRPASAMESGSVSVTISAARTSPSKLKSTRTTNIPPSRTARRNVRRQIGGDRPARWRAGASA